LKNLVNFSISIYCRKNVRRNSGDYIILKFCHDLFDVEKETFTTKSRIESFIKFFNLKHLNITVENWLERTLILFK
jgi:tRNA splicing ligase